ncbi:S8 family serine peptidase [Candidatus Woesearchaeota archaeon]|nr:S8 family serine peptidase [Candidatus Woesearchaeota archaeon]
MRPKKGYFWLLVLIVLMSLANAALLDPKVTERMQSTNAEERIPVIITFKAQSESYPVRTSRSASTVSLTRHPQDNGLSTLEQEGFELKRELPQYRAVAGTLTPQGLAALQSESTIASIEYDTVLKVHLSDTVPIILANSVQNLIYNGTAINGTGQTVCILDTGVNYSHQYLGNCTNTTFLAGNCSKVIGGYDYASSPNDNDPADDNGHGTHVAGIIASEHPTYKGVAPGASLVAVKVCNSFGSCSTSNIASGINWCVSNASLYNISVISMSLGSDAVYTSADCPTGTLTTAINNARAAGIIVAVSSGNGGSAAGISSPACTPNATAVGAVNKTSGFWPTANRYPGLLTLLAPGVNVISLSYLGTTTTLSGTSMAAPHVSGAAVLLLQYKKAESNTTLTPTQLFAALNQTGTPVNDSQNNTYKLINVFAAIGSLDTTPPIITLISPTPANNTDTNDTTLIVNISSTESLSSAFLELDGTNMSMNGSGILWERTITGLSFGVRRFRVNVNDTGNNLVSSQQRILPINNSAPNITSFFPLESVFSIAEPSNQTFNITATDVDNDTLSYQWLVNGAGAGTAATYTFPGNYSQNGTYTVSVRVHDGAVFSTQNWTMTINNTNRLPGVLNVTVLPQNPLTADNLICNYTFLDLDNEPDLSTIRWWMNGSANVSLENRSTIGSGNTTKGDVWGCSVLPFDGLDIGNETFSANVSVLNAIPVMAAIANTTANELQRVNISANATDADGDALTYAINDSRFSQSVNTFTWNTTLTDAGTYALRFNVSDGAAVAYRDVVLTIINVPDCDNDSLPYYADTDDDGDGILDDVDPFVGCSDAISTSSTGVAVLLNNSSNTSGSLNSTENVTLQVGNETVVEFSFNFSNASLRLYNVSLERQTTGYGAFAIANLTLPSSVTKSIYISKVNTSWQNACIRDIGSTTISSISAGCNATNETYISCNNTTQSGYTCFDLGSTFKITGLRHSAVAQTCTTSWSCTDWSSCSESTQTRACTDANGCGITADKPAESQSCSGGGSPLFMKGGGGGGGGGGGSGSSPLFLKISSESATSISHSFATLTKKAGINITINKEAIPITTFIASLPADITHKTVLTFNAIEVPSPRPVGQVYGTFLISAVSLDKSDITQGTITVAVDKSWFLEQGLQTQDVVISQMKGNVWSDLPTKIIGGTKTSVSYEMPFVDFGTFAIRIPPQIPAQDEVPPQNTSALNQTSQNATTSLPPVLEQPAQVAPALDTEQKNEKKQLPYWLGIVAVAIVVGFFLVYILVFRSISKRQK